VGCRARDGHAGTADGDAPRGPARPRSEWGWTSRYTDASDGLAATIDRYRGSEGRWRPQKEQAEAGYAARGHWTPSFSAPAGGWPRRCAVSRHDPVALDRAELDITDASAVRANDWARIDVVAETPTCAEAEMVFDATAAS
jgi:hypothetical protein